MVKLGDKFIDIEGIIHTLKISKNKFYLEGLNGLVWDLPYYSTIEEADNRINEDIRRGYLTEVEYEDNINKQIETNSENEIINQLKQLNETMNIILTKLTKIDAKLKKI